MTMEHNMIQVTKKIQGTLHFTLQQLDQKYLLKEIKLGKMNL